MYQKLTQTLLILFILLSCSKKEELSIKPPDADKAYEIYEEGLTSMKKGDFFTQQKNFLRQKKFFQ